MEAGTAAATQLFVDAWVVLVVGAGLIASVIGTGLGIIFHLGGRIDHQSDRIDGVTAEVAAVGARVARLEGSTGTPDPDPLQLA